MAKVVWSNYLIPEAETPVVPFHHPLFGESDCMIRPLRTDHASATLPIPLSKRNLSRSGLLLALACIGDNQDSVPLLKPWLEQDPFSVGIYCALEPGPIDIEPARELAASGQASLHEIFRRAVSPKSYLRFLPNLPASQLAAFFGIKGRVVVHTHTRKGSELALQNAENDLSRGTVKAALVCSAFSFENPLAVFREASRLPTGTHLCEGAAALVLTENHQAPPLPLAQTNDYYAIADDLIKRAIAHEKEMSE